MSENKSSYAELEKCLVTKVTVKMCDECTGFFKLRNILNYCTNHCTYIKFTY